GGPRAPPRGRPGSPTPSTRPAAGFPGTPGRGGGERGRAGSAPTRNPFTRLAGAGGPPRRPSPFQEKVMKVYYTSTRLEVVDDLERLVFRTLENTGVFGRFWTEVSHLTEHTRSPTITLAAGYAVYFLGGHDSLYDKLSNACHASVDTTTQKGVVVATK